MSAVRLRNVSAVSMKVRDWIPKGVARGGVRATFAEKVRNFELSLATGKVNYDFASS